MRSYTFRVKKNTQNSAEIYPYHKLLIIADSTLDVYGLGRDQLQPEMNEAAVTPADIPAENTVYTEISIRKEDVTMNVIIKPGEVFKPAELVPYAEGKIVNMDVLHNSKMKFVVMSFDEGTGLSEHAAPGEAIIFAPDGKAVIGFKGKDHTIKAGENFHFAKAGLHSVKAVKRFKMALLLLPE